MSARQCLVALLEATALHPPSCSWLGESHLIVQRGDEGRSDAVVRGLSRRLYADFYVTGGVAPPLPPRVRSWSSALEPPPLSSSNPGTGSPQGGWTEMDREGTSVVVERRGLRLWADATRVRPSLDGIEVLLPEESIGLPSGFYTAYGDAGSCEPANGAVHRYYWNVRAEGRAALLAEVTGRLNRNRLPFRFKVLNDPETVRCDMGVLYIGARFREHVAPLLPEIAGAVAGLLRRRVPALTKPLAPGIGFAEDPVGDESFGTHRCALVAEALVAAYTRGLGTDEARLGVIAERFALAGLSLDHPHLNPGSDPTRDPLAIA